MAVKIFGTIDKVKPFFDMVSFVILQISKVFLVITVIVTSLMVAGRFIAFMPGFHWSEEIILTSMSYMSLLAAALALRSGSHIRMVVLDKFLSKSFKKVMDVIITLFMLYISYIFLTVGWEFAVTIGGRGSYIAIPWLSLIVRYFPIPLGGFFMCFFGIELLYKNIRAFFIEESYDGDDDTAIAIEEKDGETE